MASPEGDAEESKGDKMPPKLTGGKPWDRFVEDVDLWEEYTSVPVAKRAAIVGAKSFKEGSDLHTFAKSWLKNNKLLARTQQVDEVPAVAAIPAAPDGT